MQALMRLLLIQRDLCRGREVVFASHGLLWAAQKGALCTTTHKSLQHVRDFNMSTCCRCFHAPEFQSSRLQKSMSSVLPTCNRSNSLKSLNLLFFKVNVVPALLAKDCCGHLLVKSGPLSCWQDGYVEARTEDISTMPHDAIGAGTGQVVRDL